MNTYFKNIEILTGIKESKLEEYAARASVPELFNNLDTIDITEKQKEKAKALIEFVSDRLQMSVLHETSSLLNSSSLAKKFCSTLLRYKANEELYVIFLNTQNKILGYEKLFTGTVTEAAVYPRIIIETALKYKRCAGIILAHNHPGGKKTPSPQDVEITKRIRDVLSVIGIRLCDHIIVTDTEEYSFADNFLIEERSFI